MPEYRQDPGALDAYAGSQSGVGVVWNARGGDQSLAPGNKTNLCCSLWARAATTMHIAHCDRGVLLLALEHIIRRVVRSRMQAGQVDRTGRSPGTGRPVWVGR